MPEPISITTAAEADIHLTTSYDDNTPAGELAVSYDGDELSEREGLVVEYQEGLEVRLHIADFPATDPSWVVSATPRTRSTDDWPRSGAGIIDADTGPTANGDFVAVEVTATPTATGEAPRKKTIHIKIKPKQPQPPRGLTGG